MLFLWSRRTLAMKPIAICYCLDCVFGRSVVWFATSNDTRQTNIFTEFMEYLSMTFILIDKSRIHKLFGAAKIIPTYTSDIDQIFSLCNYRFLNLGNRWLFFAACVKLWTMFIQETPRFVYENHQTLRGKTEIQMRMEFRGRRRIESKKVIKIWVVKCNSILGSVYLNMHHKAQA